MDSARRFEDDSDLRRSPATEPPLLLRVHILGSMRFHVVGSVAPMAHSRSTVELLTADEKQAGVSLMEGRVVTS